MGAPGHSDKAGAAYLFLSQAGVWTQLGTVMRFRDPVQAGFGSPMQLGAHALAMAPTSGGEGTSPKAWRQSVWKARAKARIHAGTMSMMTREIPAEQP